MDIVYVEDVIGDHTTESRAWKMMTKLHLMSTRPTTIRYYPRGNQDQLRFPEGGVSHQFAPTFASTRAVGQEADDAGQATRRGRQRSSGEAESEGCRQHHHLSPLSLAAVAN